MGVNAITWKFKALDSIQLTELRLQTVLCGHIQNRTNIEQQRQMLCYPRIRQQHLAGIVRQTAKYRVPAPDSGSIPKIAQILAARSWGLINDDPLGLSGVDER
jgi:hypothetical protein